MWCHIPRSRLSCKQILPTSAKRNWTQLLVRPSLARPFPSPALRESMYLSGEEQQALMRA